MLREGRGRTHVLLALVIWPLTTHPFRDGAPFLLVKGEGGERRDDKGVCRAEEMLDGGMI